MQFRILHFTLIRIQIRFRVWISILGYIWPWNLVRRKMFNGTGTRYLGTYRYKVKNTVKNNYRYQ